MKSDLPKNMPTGSSDILGVSICLQDVGLPVSEARLQLFLEYSKKLS